MARSGSRRSAIAQREAGQFGGVAPGGRRRFNASCARRHYTASNAAAPTRSFCRHRPRQRRTAEARSAQDRGTSRSSRNDSSRGAWGARCLYRRVAHRGTALRARDHRAGTWPKRAWRPQEFGSAMAGGAGTAAAHPRYCAGAAAARGSRGQLSAAAPPLNRNETNSRISPDNGKNAAAFLLRGSVGTVKRRLSFHLTNWQWPTIASSYPTSTG